MDDFSETFEDCLKILDENIEILANIEIELEDEKEDDLVTDLQLHQLYDIAEDVFESSKIKRAEINLVRRQTEDSL